MAVAIGASCSFSPLIGHQNNMLILGPGGFRFGEITGALAYRWKSFRGVGHAACCFLVDGCCKPQASTASAKRCCG